MAIKTAGTIVYMESAISAANSISAVALTSPGEIVQVTVGSATGYAGGEIIKITGCGGMQQINDRAFVVGTVSSPDTTFQLKGVKGTYYTTYTSGGSVYTATLTAIGEVRDVPSLGGSEPNEFDVSHLLSVVQQKLAGLPTQAAVTFNVWFSPANARHIDLQRANEDLQDRVFQFNKSGTGGFNLTLVAQVSGFTITGGDVNTAYSAAVTLTPRAAVAVADLT